nr:MAG TPA: hypothetical protein [Caudoviricetes sp.]DAG86400.1 MAG TPA: hypothetical protein [Caudoviricetes sp.]DAL87825.1 MAG TPA: hypothetical protein [Caudoviricetes sp.]
MLIVLSSHWNHPFCCGSCFSKLDSKLPGRMISMPDLSIV